MGTTVEDLCNEVADAADEAWRLTLQAIDAAFSIVMLEDPARTTLMAALTENIGGCLAPS